MMHNTPPPMPPALMALRPEGAAIPRESVIDVCNVAVQLDELLHLKGLEATTPEQWAALWGADAPDLFGMLDDWEARLGLDAHGMKCIRVTLIEIFSEGARLELLAEKFSELVRDAVGDELSRVQYWNRNDPEAIAGNVCHSNDFADSNQLMIDAEESLGIEYDMDSDTDLARVSRQRDAAWKLAKSRGFAPRIHWEGYAAFLAAFPQTNLDYSTGGGCTAWHIPCGAGYILITDGNLCQPTPGTVEVDAGSYDSEGDWIEENQVGALEPMNWEEAIAWVRARLAKTSPELTQLDWLTEACDAWYAANNVKPGSICDVLADARAGRITLTERQVWWLRCAARKWDEAN